MLSQEVQDDLLFGRHGELIEREAYLKNALENHRKNASQIIGGSREALIEHRITCDVLSTKLNKVRHDLEFTERLIAARFQSGKIDMREKYDGM